MTAIQHNTLFTLLRAMYDKPHNLPADTSQPTANRRCVREFYVLAFDTVDTL